MHRQDGHRLSYQILQGDALQILPTLEAGSIDAMILDLPYGTTNCNWDSVIPFVPMWEQVKRLLKTRGVFVTTASQPFTSALVMSNLDWFRYCWVWKKSKATGFLDANKRPLNNFEDVVVFSANAPAYNPQMKKGMSHKRGPNGRANPVGVYNGFTDKQTESNEFYPNRIIEFTSSDATHHPTQKPVSLYSYLIRTYTNPGDTVLDFCAGSFTTGVACIKEGRNFVGIELDEHYFNVGRKRLEEAAMQLPLALEMSA